MAYHGNLQKIRNGKRTFAITPHIPGGFIKPEGLIKIGEVAKKCSITAMSLINLIIIGASIYICMLLIMKDRFLLENMNIAINKLMNKKVNN